MKGMNCEYFKKRVVGCGRILVFSSIVYTRPAIFWIWLIPHFVIGDFTVLCISGQESYLENILFWNWKVENEM
jgi:hypothetical protein